MNPNPSNNGKVFPEGIRFFNKHPNAPEWVLASGVITLDDLFAFAHNNPNLLTDYNGKKQLKIQILLSREGTIYSTVDTYGTPSYQPPRQQPQAQGWGAPQQPQGQPQPFQQPVQQQPQPAQQWQPGAPQVQPLQGAQPQKPDFLPF